MIARETEKIIAMELAAGRNPTELALSLGIEREKVYYVRRKHGIESPDFRMSRRGPHVPATTKYQRRRHKLMQAGKCPVCGKDPEREFVLCDLCRAKRSAIVWKYRMKQRRKQEIFLPPNAMVLVKKIAIAMKQPTSKVVELAIAEWTQRNGRATPSDSDSPSKFTVEAVELEIALRKRLERETCQSPK